LIVETDCVFCAIVKGDAPAEIVYEDDATLAFMDIHPAAQGHTLVIPREHFRNIYDIEEEALLATARTTMKVARAVRAAFEPDGLNILQANEPGGFQSVFHFHFHIIPRWVGDDLIRPWRPRPTGYAQIREAAKLIRKQLS
jgi:histidine triad (HIT) family protein